MLMGKNRKIKKDKENVIYKKQENIYEGRAIVAQNDFFGSLLAYTGGITEKRMGKIPYQVTVKGKIYVNPETDMPSKQWAYGITVCVMHVFWGHYLKKNMPGYEVMSSEGGKHKIVCCDFKAWNLACDIWCSRFLEGIKFAGSFDLPILNGVKEGAAEKEIYDYLIEHKEILDKIYYIMNMEGLDHPAEDEENDRGFLTRALAVSAANTVWKAMGYTKGLYRNIAERAAEWFVGNYPLLGAVAASFQIIYDSTICIQEEVQIAAVDMENGKIFCNPAAYLGFDGWKFVLAHEYLHAGLQHLDRRQGRDPFFWNAACDFVINGWLVDMGIGKLPEGGLYDEKLINLSAEEIYDCIIRCMNQYKGLHTFRGYEKGDMMGNGTGKKKDGMDLDALCRNALQQGLDYHQKEGRGYLPAGLIEEIRALSVPAPAWDVQLAHWFENEFSPREKVRTYARPSRRQGSTPDIPRPRYAKTTDNNAYTFGVIIDTSGSMSRQMMGMGLGAIASYAVQKEVAYVRVVFCDAQAYDAGYMAVDEIAGRVNVKGRGGTRLQPGIDLLESASDFPDDGPVLIITDGEIEDELSIHRKHAYLLPENRRLPFRAKGAVFYMAGEKR